MMNDEDFDKKDTFLDFLERNVSFLSKSSSFIILSLRLDNKINKPLKLPSTKVICLNCHLSESSFVRMSFVRKKKQKKISKVKILAEKVDLAFYLTA